MKLMLTSNGLSNDKLKKEFTKLLDRPAKEIKVLVMRNTPQTEKDDEYFLAIIEELRETGVKKENISFVSVHGKISAEDYKLEEYDVFWSCGGNTFTILDRVRKTGFDKWIKEWIKKDKLYVGTSAGTILIGPSIELAGWGSECDDNYISLEDLNGLNLIDIAIYPHYRDEVKKDVEEFIKKIKGKYGVKTLADGEAWIVDGKKTRTI